MAVLVTGGAGYIGSQMVHELVDRQIEVVVLDDLSTGEQCNLPSCVPLVIESTGSRAAVRELVAAYGVDTIMHFAASIIVERSVVDPLSYYQNNTCNSQALLCEAVQAGIRNFIFSSTAAVYGNVNQADEEMTPSPSSPYGFSKWMTEIMLQHAAESSELRFMALRYFNVAGADPQRRTGQGGPHATHLIKLAVQAALGIRPHLNVYGTDYCTPDGTCVRDYIHVADLAKVHAAALDALQRTRTSQIINCGYGHGYSVREVIEAVKAVSGVDFLVKEGPRRAGDPSMLVANVSKISRTLDWRPQHDDLHLIVQDALAWERILMSRPKCT